MASFKEPRADTVFLRNMVSTAVVGLDRWHNPNVSQPVNITLEITKKRNIVSHLDDDVDNSIRYDFLEAAISERIAETDKFDSIWDLTNDIIGTTYLQKNVYREDTTIVATAFLPKGLLLTDGYGFSVKAATIRDIPWQLCLFVKNLRVSCIIGMLDQERPKKQAVVINLWFHNPKDCDFHRALFEKCSELVERVNTLVEHSNFATLEALATAIARILCLDVWMDTVTVSISKPSALTFVEDSGVEITRNKAYFLS